MTKATIANAIFEMTRIMEGLPTRRAYAPIIEEDGSDGEEEVPLGTKDAEVWATVETRWPMDNGAAIEWIISEREEAFEKRRQAAVEAAKTIAGRMLRGETFAEARRKVLDHACGVWDGDLPSGYSNVVETPWWLI